LRGESLCAVFNGSEVGNLLRTPHRREKDATVFAISAWDGRTAPAADKPGMTVRLYLPDMRRSLSQTTWERIDRDRLEIKDFRDVCLASRET
jgi:hypothetical protein